jgi:hypothetical protein
MTATTGKARVAQLLPLVMLALQGTAATGTTGARPVVTVHPGVVHLGDAATVRVSGASAAALSVRLVGATTRTGAALPWVPLSRHGNTWEGRLPRPSLHGVYPIELRDPTAGRRVWRCRCWLVRVLARGTLARPSYATPEAVARWWVRTVPPGARLVAQRRWPRPAFDRRDPRLHQLLVIAYRPAGDRRVDHRLGIFITAFRNSYRGRWRLLEATVLP